MSKPIPSQIALTQIVNGTPADGSVVQSNYAEIQSALNTMIAALSGGTAGQVLQAVDGSDVVYSASGVLSETTILNGTVSYTAPGGASKLQLEGIGGGGGGAGCIATGVGQTAWGGAAGGGAYAYKLLASNIGTHTVAVGAGGAGGSAANGNPGGDTTFANSVATVVLTAKGASGGLAGAVNVQVAGSNGGAQPLCLGDITLGGCPGAITSSAGTSSGGAAARGGGGGTSTVSAGSDGNPGQNYGGGGCGAINGASQPARTGGNGANGILFVRALGQ